LPKKKTTVMLEPDNAGPVPVVTDGSIGVEYTPPPVGEREEAQTYLCANCQGEIELRAPRCQTCNESIDWSSLDD
jgi:hypothetical protein